MKKKQLLRLVPVFIALVLLLWNLWDDSVNLYYAAGVYSMRQSWHAFFFNSLDSVGFISIDKPPLGLWIQTITTLVFGFDNFALLLPQIVDALSTNDS